MPDWLRHLAARLADAAKSGGLWLGLGLSIVLAVASLAVAVAVVVTWPEHRFQREASASSRTSRPPPVRVLVHLSKNVSGLVLLLLGFIMALPGVPGQGVLTMIIGLTLLDFPGKLRLERRLVGRPFVLKRLNALRRRFRRPPLCL